MLGKLLIGSGIFLILSGVIGCALGIYSTFQAMKFNENAGIGAIGTGIQFALISSIFALVGFILLIIGWIKLYRDKKSFK